jgi:hypothetical protein
MGRMLTYAYPFSRFDGERHVLQDFWTALKQSSDACREKRVKKAYDGVTSSQPFYLQPTAGWPMSWRHAVHGLLRLLLRTEILPDTLEAEGSYELSEPTMNQGSYLLP